jgi:hypothetical protein
MEHTAATLMQRWWKQLPSCRRCGSKFYRASLYYREDDGRHTYKCGDCRFDRYYTFDRSPDDEEEDPFGYPSWRSNVRDHKLYDCGITNRLRDETYEQAQKSNIHYDVARHMARSVIDIALKARSEVRMRGAKEATQISLLAGRAAIKSYSNGTTSTSVGGADGVY